MTTTYQCLENAHAQANDDLALNPMQLSSTLAQSNDRGSVGQICLSKCFSQASVCQVDCLGEQINLQVNLYQAKEKIVKQIKTVLKVISIAISHQQRSGEEKDLLIHVLCRGQRGHLHYARHVATTAASYGSEHPEGTNVTITEEESVDLTNVAHDDNSDITNLSVNGSIIACWGEYGGMVTYVPDSHEERYLDRLSI